MDMRVLAGLHLPTHAHAHLPPPSTQSGSRQSEGPDPGTLIFWARSCRRVQVFFFQGGQYCAVFVLPPAPGLALRTLSLFFLERWSHEAAEVPSTAPQHRWADLAPIGRGCASRHRMPADPCIRADLTHAGIPRNMVFPLVHAQTHSHHVHIPICMRIHIVTRPSEPGPQALGGWLC